MEKKVKVSDRVENGEVLSVRERVSESDLQVSSRSLSWLALLLPQDSS